jgi:hypothetical protein
MADMNWRTIMSRAGGYAHNTQNSQKGVQGGIFEHFEDTESKASVSPPDWLTAWRELATLTIGIDPSAPRFQLVLHALEQCDTAYLAGDWPTFQRVTERVKRAVKGA